MGQDLFITLNLRGHEGSKTENTKNVNSGHQIREERISQVLGVWQLFLLFEEKKDVSGKAEKLFRKRIPFTSLRHDFMVNQMCNPGRDLINAKEEKDL